ncbi:MAG: PilW family protein [Peptoniphilaceae bacterium]
MKRSYKLKGFTLIELIVSIAISFIILSILTSSLYFISKSAVKINEKDTFQEKSYFAINYIYDEVSSADYIIKKDNKAYKFVIVNCDLDGKKENYNYIYYYLNKDRLNRYAINSEIKNKYGDIKGRWGVNKIADNVKKYNVNFHGNKIEINIKLEKNGVEEDYTYIIANRTFGEFK